MRRGHTLRSFDAWESNRPFHAVLAKPTDVDLVGFLARLELGGGEAPQLRLEDIDWCGAGRTWNREIYCRFTCPARVLSLVTDFPHQ